MECVEIKTSIRISLKWLIVFAHKITIWLSSEMGAISRQIVIYHQISISSMEMVGLLILSTMCNEKYLIFHLVNSPVIQTYKNLLDKAPAVLSLLIVDIQWRQLAIWYTICINTWQNVLLVEKLHCSTPKH